MLRELRVKNFGVIEEATVPFGPGLNVLTGETGAGKSLLIDAIFLLLGARAQTDLIQSGAEKALVEACFEIAPKSPAERLLEELGYGVEDRQVIIRRELSRTGRHRAFVNDTPTTVSLLEQFKAVMVEIHGQHEHQQLLQPSQQLELLDRFAGLSEGREALGEKVRQWRALHEESESLRGAARERTQKEDLYLFQAKEIDGAALTPNEDEALRAERRRLQHASQLTEGLTQISAHLYDDSRSALSNVGRAESLLRELARIDPDLNTVLADLEAGQAHLEEAARSVRLCRDRVAVDPERLQEIDARLDAITKLKRKYGESIEAVLAYRGKIEEELSELSHRDERIKKSEEMLQQLTREIREEARSLSARRESAATKLESLARKELKSLGMEMAQFGAKLSHEAARPGDLGTEEGWRVGAHGIDQVEFLFSDTPGEPLKPLARVASGGELSRTSLALKTVLANSDAIPVLIFDEVDSGIGGRVADSVGLKLQTVSKTHQVICVTHLPQIVAYADFHLKIEKRRRGKTVHTAVELLNKSSRVEELARMLGGERLTKTTLRHAEEILSSRGPHLR